MSVNVGAATLTPKSDARTSGVAPDLNILEPLLAFSDVPSANPLESVALGNRIDPYYADISIRFLRVFRVREGSDAVPYADHIEFGFPLGSAVRYSVQQLRYRCRQGRELSAKDKSTQDELLGAAKDTE
jgi:hypothetical protein